MKSTLCSPTAIHSLDQFVICCLPFQRLSVAIFYAICSTNPCSRHVLSPHFCTPLQCSLNAISNAIDMTCSAAALGFGDFRFCLIMKMVFGLRRCWFLMRPHNMAGLSSRPVVLY